MTNSYELSVLVDSEKFIISVIKRDRLHPILLSSSFGSVAKSLDRCIAVKTFGK